MKNQKKKVQAKVLEQKMTAPDIYDMELETELAEGARAGQFIGIYPGDKSTLLPRPVSICEANPEKGTLRIVYRVAGKGTGELSSYRAGDKLEILGILGNGFPIEEGREKRVLLLGGGIGIPPMLELAKELTVVKARVTAVLGYRDGRLFLKEDMDKYAKVFIATEDGSAGTKGNVLTAVEAEGIEADVIMACGPTPMLRAVREYAMAQKIKAYISLEERMACGIGACLSCVCRTGKTDTHSHVKNARVCADGPVFDAEIIDFTQ